MHKEINFMQKYSFCFYYANKIIKITKIINLLNHNDTTKMD